MINSVSYYFSATVQGGPSARVPFPSAHVVEDRKSEILLGNHTSWDETLEDFKTRLVKLNDVTVLIILCLYVVIFITGLVGNISLAYCNGQSKYSPQGVQQNWMLLNLCVADLLVILICCPATAYHTTTTLWTMGRPLCKISAYFQGVAVTAGTLSLTALSLDRYLFIHRPFTIGKISRRRLAFFMITVVWAAAGCLSVPVLFVRDTHSLKIGGLEVTFCIEQWQSDNLRKLFTVMSLLFVYALPCAVLVLCHASVSCTLCTADTATRRRDALPMTTITSQTLRTSPTSRIPRHYRQKTCSHFLSEGGTSSGRMASLVSLECSGQHQTQSFQKRRRLANVLMGMTVCFVACWLPYNFVSVYLDFDPNHGVTMILPFTLLLGHAHSAINPVVYWMLNRSARRKTHTVIKFKHSANAKDCHVMPVICMPFHNNNAPSTTSTGHELKVFPKNANMDFITGISY